MSKEIETLETVAKEAYRHAKEMMFTGSVPVYLGINGMLALMLESIRRDIEKPSDEDLISLVAHGIHALSLSKEEQEWSDIGKYADLETPLEDIDEEDGDDGSGRWEPPAGTIKIVREDGKPVHKRSYTDEEK